MVKICFNNHHGSTQTLLSGLEAPKLLAMQAYQAVKPLSSVASNLSVHPEPVWHYECPEYRDVSSIQSLEPAEP